MEKLIVIFYLIDLFEIEFKGPPNMLRLFMENLKGEFWA